MTIIREKENKKATPREKPFRPAQGVHGHWRVDRDDCGQPAAADAVPNIPPTYVHALSVVAHT